MSNWWATREVVKRAGYSHGTERDTVVDRNLEAASRMIERQTRRFFVPRTETRLYRWPDPRRSRAHILWLDQDLISVTTLQTRAQDSSPTTIASSDYFIEPNNQGPPYNRIEIDHSSTAAFEAGDTPQRSISVAGSWGYGNDTKPGGTVASGLDSDAAATSMVPSDASLIDVGHTLLIESEQLFVVERSFAALSTIKLDGALSLDKGGVTVTVDGSHGIQAREIIRVDSEQMFVEAVNTNDLTVIRSYNGTVLASHTDDTAVNINRTLTVERGKNGSTAATHADSTAISVYEPPFDIQEWCIAEALAMLAQEGAMWGREIGGGEGARELSDRSLKVLRERMLALYRRGGMRHQAI